MGHMNPRLCPRSKLELRWEPAQFDVISNRSRSLNSSANSSCTSPFWSLSPMTTLSGLRSRWTQPKSCNRLHREWAILLPPDHKLEWFQAEGACSMLWPLQLFTTRDFYRENEPWIEDAGKRWTRGKGKMTKFREYTEKPRFREEKKEERACLLELN